MNTDKLKLAEDKFMSRYPEGFQSPEMIEIGKKHKMKKTVEFAQTIFAESQFELPGIILEQMIRLVSRSSMVSVFEKPKYRDFVRSLDTQDKYLLADSLYQILHGNQKTGFNMMLNLLAEAKLAKWTYMTVFGAYFNPDYDLLVKPTTTKKVLSYLEISDIKYRPKPDYDFYYRYRNYVNSMKKEVNPSLSPNNAAFLGFLMMSC